METIKLKVNSQNEIIENGCNTIEQANDFATLKINLINKILIGNIKRFKMKNTVFMFVFFMFANIVSYSQFCDINISNCNANPGTLEILNDNGSFWFKRNDTIFIVNIHDFGKITHCNDEIVYAKFSLGKSFRNILEVEGIPDSDKDFFRYEVKKQSSGEIVTLPYLNLDTANSDRLEFDFYEIFTPNIIGIGKKTFCYVISSDKKAAGDDAGDDIVYISISKSQIEILGLTAIPNSLNFGDIAINKTYSEKIKIENQSTEPSTIKTAYLQNGTDFKLETNLNGLLVNGLDSVFAEISINSNIIGEKTDTLVIEADYSICGKCYLKIPIYANIKEPLKFTLRVSKHDLVDPNKTNYKIPIYITASEDVTDITIEKLVIEFDINNFYPRRVDNGTMRLDIIDNTVIETVLENMKVPNLQAEKEATLLTVAGYAILGNKDSSGILIKDIKFSNQFLPEPNFELVDGYITIDICLEGGKRLLETKEYDPAVIVKVNPITKDILEVQCRTVERGNHTLEIIDLLGKTTLLEEFTSGQNNWIFDFNIPMQSFSVGSYFLVMKSPTSNKIGGKRYITKFILQR